VGDSLNGKLRKTMLLDKFIDLLCCWCKCLSFHHCSIFYKLNLYTVKYSSQMSEVYSKCMWNKKYLINYKSF
jgi:hypothetical protein